MVRRFGLSGMLTGVTMVLVGITVLSGAVLASVPVSADDDASVDDVSIVVPTACTLSGTGTGTHTATINPGQYVADIGTTTLKALCNDANGFAIYATGYTGNTIGETNSNKLVGQNTAETIVTGLATSGDTSNWAMKLATDPNATYPVTIESAPNTSGGSPASFASYHVVPNEYTKVATRLQSTDVGTNATGSTLTSTYATYVSAGQVGDTYNGKVIYTLVHPNDHATPVAPLLATDCPANNICYAPNANDIDGSMESISSTKITKSPTAGVQNVASNWTYALIAPNYSRDGYGFAGWSTDYSATPTSIIYGPNETITTSTSGTGDADVSTNGLILYPVWIASAGSIQGWNGCNSLTQAPAPSTGNRATLASMTALTDQRDGNTYTVAKLADGNCWMTENLRLNAEDTLGDANKALAQGYGDATAKNRGKFVGLPNSENANFDTHTPPVANNLYSADGSNNTININASIYPYDRIPRYNNNNNNRMLTADYGSSNDTYYQWYAYGNYYNWPAAMANTDHFDAYSASESANTSICPIGWRLPTGGDKTRIETDQNNELWNLVVVNLNNNTLPANYDSQSAPYYTGSAEGTSVSNLVRAFPNNFVRSGFFTTSGTNYRGTGGFYWSSSAQNSGVGVYSFYFQSTNIYPGTYIYPKFYARSIRCLLDSQQIFRFLVNNGS